jgi:hypothetical protein
MPHGSHMCPRAQNANAALFCQHLVIPNAITETVHIRTVYWVHLGPSRSDLDSMLPLSRQNLKARKASTSEIGPRIYILSQVLCRLELLHVMTACL